MFYDLSRFHVLVLFAWQFTVFFINQLIFPIFSNYVPQWQCGDGPIGKDCSEYNRCGGNVTLVGATFRSVALEYGFICGPQAYYGSLFSQAQFGGVLLGTFLFGTMSDFFGRRPVSILTLTVGILMNFLTGLAPSLPILLLIRFIMGLCIGGSSVVVITFSMEMILPKQRIILRAVVNCGIARIMITTICYFFPDWRAASMVCSLATVPALLIIVIFFPESPTWLHNKGKVEAREKSEKYIAKICGTQYLPIEHKKSHKVKTFCQVIRTKGLFKRLLVLWTMWFTTCLTGYAIDFNSSNLSGDLYANQILFGVLIVASKMILLFVDSTFPKFNRRHLHQGAQLVICLCFLVLTVLTIEGYQGVFSLIINLIGTMFIEYTWDACYLCSIESMETSCRSSATGSCSLVARIGALIAPVLNFLNTQWPPAVYFTVMGMGTVSLLVSYFFLVETKTIPLEEVQMTDSTTDPLEQPANSDQKT